VAFKEPVAADVFRAYDFAGKLLKAPSTVIEAAAWFVKNIPASYDVVFDASSVEHIRISRIMSRLCARRACVGYDYGSFSRLYSIRLDTALLASFHMKDIYAGLMHPFCGKKTVELELFPKRRESECNLSLPNKGARIIMHPGGRDNISQFEKRWPLERYVLLAKMLVNTFPCHIIMIGSKNESEWIEQAIKKEKEGRIINLAGRTGIDGMIECVRSASLFIGNNSGPLHIASACMVPIVTFAGGVPLYRWGVTPDEKTRVLGIDKKCSQCTEYECDRNGVPCIEAVTVDEAFGAAAGLMA
jgi:ADP-heptose:LPS heptosyltransferase